MNAAVSLAEVIPFPEKVETKVCNTCKAEKPIVGFYTKGKQPNGKLRLSHQCKPCENIRKNLERGGDGVFLTIDQVRKLSPTGELIEKRCPTCETWKAPDQFHKKTGSPYGIHFQCKSCVGDRHVEKIQINPNYCRERKILELYGITLQEARDMLTAQHGLCANRACGLEISIDGPRKGNGRKAFIDHCHETGMVRGILCISCNTALGLIEQKNKMIGLTEYLEKAQLKQGVIRHGN